MQTVRVENNEEITTTYHLQFQWVGERGSGFGFPCDEQGNVDVSSLNPAAAENYRKCINGEHKVIRVGIDKYESRVRLCDCNSGLVPEKIYDGHNIYLCRACPKCKKEKLKGYRSDIFERYDADEPIDED